MSWAFEKLVGATSRLGLKKAVEEGSSSQVRLDSMSTTPGRGAVVAAANPAAAFAGLGSLGWRVT